MVHLILTWFLSSLALLIVAYIVPGFELADQALHRCATLTIHLVQKIGRSTPHIKITPTRTSGGEEELELSIQQVTCEA